MYFVTLPNRNRNDVDKRLSCQLNIRPNKIDTNALFYTRLLARSRTRSICGRISSAFSLPLSLPPCLARSVHMSCVVCCSVCNWIFAGYWWCNCNLSKENCRKSIHFSSFSLILMIPCDIIFVTKNQTRKNTNKPKMCVCVCVRIQIPTQTDINPLNLLLPEPRWFIYQAHINRFRSLANRIWGQETKREEESEIFFLYRNSFH